MVWVFFMTPLAMIIVVERLGGHFITTFLRPDEDILENYVVTLLLYLLVFGLTGSFRASLISVTPVLLLFGGLCVALLGLAGEYLARIMSEVKQRPIYIIRESNLQEEKD